GDTAGFGGDDLSHAGDSAAHLVSLAGRTAHRAGAGGQAGPPARRLSLWRQVSNLPPQAQPARSSCSDVAACSGSRTSNVVPSFSSPVKVMAPTWASTMLLQIASPRPLPPSSRDRALSTR